MTFAVLRALHGIIGEAIDDIERVFAVEADDSRGYTPTSDGTINTNSPSSASSRYSLPSNENPAVPSLDFPSLDTPYDPTSPAERFLASGDHPELGAAISRIVAACGQLSMSVREPFLSLCDGSMGYHLPSCLRFLEATHTVEILREAGTGGLHVKEIAKMNGTDETKLAHILRLLSTHHFLIEVSPNVFANNRVSGYMDTGKEVREVLEKPEKKYEGTNGVSAFVAMCSDELFKSSAYLTEAYYMNPTTRTSTFPTEAPFNYAFGTRKGFFEWLEDGEEDITSEKGSEGGERVKGQIEAEERVPNGNIQTSAPNKYRLERFGKAMTGNSAWDTPGGFLNSGFDWASLPKGSIIVDVGGGIGSACMVLAEAFGNFRFVVQDRKAVIDIGVKAWQDQYPELLSSGSVRFQAHDFFTPQPIRDASVFLLRVVLHDWSDTFARKILLQLREAAFLPNSDGTHGTTLIIADHILPLACVDNFEEGGEMVEGASKMLAPPPLLANLGKASVNAYWMDMTMHVTFNGQERTLREIVALTLSAGWKVTKVSRVQGSLFGHIMAVPVI